MDFDYAKFTHVPFVHVISGSDVGGDHCSGENDIVVDWCVNKRVIPYTDISATHCYLAGARVRIYHRTVLLRYLTLLYYSFQSKETLA